MKNIFRTILQPHTAALAIHRAAHKLEGPGAIRGFLRVMLYRLNLMLHGIEIHPSAIIDEGVILHHTTGVVIGKSYIGKNVHIYQNVTLGARNSRREGERNGWPTIMDNVTIYAGAVVVGNIVVGENSIIGANAVVAHDVPADSLAVGVPARIISNK